MISTATRRGLLRIPVPFADPFCKRPPGVPFSVFQRSHEYQKDPWESSLPRFDQYTVRMGQESNVMTKSQNIKTAIPTYVFFLR